MRVDKLIKGAYYDISDNRDGSYIIKFKCIDAFGCVIASEYYLDGEVIKTNTDIGEIDTFPMVEVAGFPTKPTRGSYETHDKGEVITDTKKLIPGKWYFGSTWQNGSCCKFIDIFRDTVRYTEKFVDGIHNTQGSHYGWHYSNSYTEVPLSYLKKFLPQDHPDLKEQANSYKQINKQTNDKNNSDSKDSELSITVSRKSPKIGEVKRAGTSGVHGRRARAVIGRYSPQNKAINSRS